MSLTRSYGSDGGNVRTAEISETGQGSPRGQGMRNGGHQRSFENQSEACMRNGQKSPLQTSDEESTSVGTDVRNWRHAVEELIRTGVIRYAPLLVEQRLCSTKGDHLSD